MHAALAIPRPRGNDSETTQPSNSSSSEGDTVLLETSREHMSTLKQYLLCTGLVITVALAAIPDALALQASPTTLSFQAVQGGKILPSQIVNVLKNSNNMVIWSSRDNAAWITVSPTMGMIARSAQVSVSVNPAGLSVGTYTAIVTITAANGGRISVPVTLTVTAGSSSQPSGHSTATLTWNPDASTNLAGYKVYLGTSSGVYSSSVSVGNVTSYTVSNLGVGNTYYFAVTAYNSSGVESGFSNEVSKSIY